MQKFLQKILLPVLFVWIGLGCSTDVDVNAPYREVKVLYCIIDPNLPFQTARISKGFQNEGLSAYEIAKNPDSSLYGPGILEVKLLEIGQSGIKREFLLKDTLISNKDSGLFYAPDQIVFKTPNFKVDTGQRYQNILYKIRITNKRTGSISEAETPVVGRNFEINEPIRFADDKPYDVGFSFKSPTNLKIIKSQNAAIIQAYFYWKIQVVKEGNVISEEIWKWSSPSDLTFASEASSIGTATLGSGSFYNFLRNELKSRGSDGVISRKFLVSELEILSASKDFKKYRDAFNNYNSLTQSLPIYSNVKNGLGVMAAINYSRVPVRLNGVSEQTIKDSIPEFKIIR